MVGSDTTARTENRSWVADDSGTARVVDSEDRAVDAVDAVDGAGRAGRDVTGVVDLPEDWLHAVTSRATARAQERRFTPFRRPHRGVSSTRPEYDLALACEGIAKFCTRESPDARR
jgi:hypothetical protein